jgi:2-keto-4-pentenoate hydratase/2-oxohepta-3-ene-1,7-dioic acid hydratase in catechol pathway
MVISIERQIEYLSSIATLNPGDVIATGSPAGNGSHYGVFIQPGDEITGEITGLGRQHLKFS